MEPIELPQPALQRLQKLLKQQEELSQTVQTYVICAADFLEVDLSEYRFDPQAGAFVPVAESQED